LFLFGDWGESLIDKLLEALAAIGLGSEKVAFRVGGDAVDGVEFTGLAAAVAEAG